jgi:hypothetical protein
VNDENRALAAAGGSDRRAGISEGNAVENCGLVRIRAELAGGAGRAMKRGLYVTEQVVVLELRRHQEDQVQRHPEERETTPTAISQSADHVF